MRKFLRLLPILSVLACGTAFAADTTRLLTCEKSRGNSVVFGICGVSGCSAAVTVNGKVTTYSVNRKKNTDGSLDYTPTSGAKKKCSISVSALRSGIRSLTKVSCGNSLKGTHCTFSDPLLRD